MGTAFVSCTAPASRITQTSPEAIKATTVSEQQAQQYYERKRIIEEQRQRKEAQKKAAKRKRRALEKEKKRKAKQVELQKRKQAEKKGKQVKLRLEKQVRAEKEAKRKAQQEAEARQQTLEEERKHKQQALKRAAEESLAQEEAKRAVAEHQSMLKMRKRQIGQWTRQYIGTLRSSIEAQWKKPPASIQGGDCVVKVQQKEDGTVLSAEVIRCEGDKLYQRSVIEAVWKADPLPLAPAKDVFDPEIELRFRKEYGG